MLIYLSNLFISAYEFVQVQALARHLQVTQYYANNASD